MPKNPPCGELIKQIHGELEKNANNAMRPLGLTMAQNLVYALMVNAGQMETILSTVPQAQAEVLRSGLQSIAATPTALFLLSPLERVIALVLHMSLSVLVWRAVTGKFYLYVAAIGVHALVDASAVLLQQYGVPVLVIELCLAAIDAAVVFWARRVYREMNTE